MNAVAPIRRSKEERAELLMSAKTMDEIREAAALLGLTFNEAYRERRRMFDRAYNLWWAFK